MSFIALMLRINGCLRQPFQGLRTLSDSLNELRCVMSLLPANQNTSFKGRAAQQTEHREAMTKPGKSGQIELARIWLLSPGFISP